MGKTVNKCKMHVLGCCQAASNQSQKHMFDGSPARQWGTPVPDTESKHKTSVWRKNLNPSSGDMDITGTTPGKGSRSAESVGWTQGNVPTHTILQPPVKSEVGNSFTLRKSV